ncbi:hypothetical protein DCAR_0415364 [Daucus carota subsp. sativus]|uniref:Uncharacterized protein n=1 Tax=Daucus carota subsp. sativus TaxID=79200 RepID=A0AAF0WUH9_DAUCS|nr:hypothetical protein DCAR_0415364 [Daucus carota subsp. sativus]
MLMEFGKCVPESSKSHPIKFILGRDYTH